MMMMIYELCSASGATVALIVLLLFALGVSLALYAGLMSWPSRGTPFQDTPGLPAPLAAVLCTGVFGLLFGALYATTLQGFYRVELLDDEVRLHYLFPAHTVTLSRIELAQAEQVRSHLRLRPTRASRMRVRSPMSARCASPGRASTPTWTARSPPERGGAAARTARRLFPGSTCCSHPGAPPP